MKTIESNILYIKKENSVRSKKKKRTGKQLSLENKCLLANEYSLADDYPSWGGK